ncbi:MAG TPA: response regulator [Ktedonobacterales bacterium]|nr:response regulator [Ktedonobacterales bacterium]
MTTQPTHHPRLALVVDDEIELLDVLKAILVEEADFRVITAATPDIVIPLIETAPPEVLLLDLRLPGQSGWDVLATLRANPRFRTLPVLIVSAAYDLAQRAEALHDPWVDYLAKPVDLEILLQRVNKLVERRARAAENAPS